MTLERLDAAFDDFRVSAFRLQLLPGYSTDTSSYFEAWKRGEPQPSETMNTPWNKFVRDSVAAGRKMQMVHVVDMPFNDYVSYCIEWWYSARIAAGEEVLANYRDDVTEDEVGDCDFWLLDDAVAIKMNYDSDGRFVDAVELYGNDVRRCRVIRDHVLMMAHPFDHLSGVVRS